MSQAPGGPSAHHPQAVETTVRRAIAEAVAVLKAARIDQPARDARLLMAAALGIDPSRVSMVISDPLPDPAPFASLIARRAAQEPVSKIIGQRAFYGRNFVVTPDVLDPRPDTEILVAQALSEPFDTVLDLGTGSGCILLTLLAENQAARGLGTDLSEAALAVAGENRDRLGLQDRAELMAGSWFAPLDRGAKFPLIVSNPPYIAADEMEGLDAEVLRFDPASALTDFADGLSAYREIVATAPNYLTPGGRLIVEIGWQQAQAVADLFDSAGFIEVTVRQDLENRDRVVWGRMPI